MKNQKKMNTGKPTKKLKNKRRNPIIMIWWRGICKWNVKSNENIVETEENGKGNYERKHRKANELYIVKNTQHEYNDLE